MAARPVCPWRGPTPASAADPARAMSLDRVITPTILRPPERIMRLDRLGALQPSRLSFARQLLRRIAAERWVIRRTGWQLDADGNGHAVYGVDTGARHYALVVCVAGAETGVALCDGAPGPDDIARLSDSLPRADIGRATAHELCLAKAGRDPDLWDHAVARLARGLQPDAEMVAASGVLMHSGPVLASGAHSTADRDQIADRPEMHAPFQAELLMLLLMRLFARDLVEHLARAAGGANAARLDPDIADALGLGLSAGLGLAAFPVSHPCLFNTWIMAREEAIGRVVALRHVRPLEWSAVRGHLAGLAASTATSRARDPMQVARNAALAAELAQLAQEMAKGPAGDRPWSRLMHWSDNTLGPDGQEALASLMLEPYGDLVDGLGHCMSDRLDRDYRVDGSMSVGQVRALISTVHGWALDLDWSPGGAGALAWTKASDEFNPRLSPRAAAQAGPFELPLAIVHDAVRAWHCLGGYPANLAVAHVLLDHPEHRRATRRAQITGFAPYAEIRDNLIDAGVRPVDLIRATVSFLGATDFDPPSDRRMRVRVFAGVPAPGAGP